MFLQRELPAIAGHIVYLAYDFSLWCRCAGWKVARVMANKGERIKRPPDYRLEA